MAKVRALEAAPWRLMRSKRLRTQAALKALLWPTNGLMAAGLESRPPIELIQPRWLRSFSLIGRLLLADLDSETPQDQSLPSCGVVGF